MIEELLLIGKGIILTDVLTRAARTWGIFTPIRERIKGRSVYLNRLLSCYECTSVWAGMMAVIYLSYLEWPVVTYALICCRMAHVLGTGFDWMDAARAIKENQV